MSQRWNSRNPIWIDDTGPTNTVYDLLERWREVWLLSALVYGDLVRHPTVEPPGFDLRRREWLLLNRFRTSQGKCAFLNQSTQIHTYRSILKTCTLQISLSI
jgi:hypothetical protein